LDGDWVGNLAGQGSLTVFNRWHLCRAVPASWQDDTASCDQPAVGNEPTVTFSEQQLLKVSGNAGVEIAAAADATIPASENTVGSTMSLTAVSVGGNRVASQDPSGQVTIYAANGDQLTQIAVPGGSFAGTVLQGSQLVTLRDGNLELYDVDSGELVKTISLADGAVLRDLHKGLAVYMLGRKVHVIRLANEKDITYSPIGKGAVDAQLTGAGLFYSYNFPGGSVHGRIAFVRYANVLRRLR
jgi:hypothetical protein